jgi:outer membrane protein TolC
VKTTVIALITCGLAWPVLAQAPSPALTLEMAIDRALNHPQARAAAARASAAHADAGAARTNLWPQLNLAATTNGGFSGSSGGLGIAGMSNSPFRRQYGAALEARGTVWDFGRTWGHIRATDAAANGADAAADVTRLDLTLEVVRRYYTALALRAVASASSERVTAATALRDQIRVLADAGVRPGAERDLAELDLAAARSQQVEADAAAATARDRLLVFVGLNPAEPVAIADREPTIAEVPSLDGLFPTLGNRPELKAAQAAINVAVAERQAATAEFQPSIVATGSLGDVNPPVGGAPGHWAAALGFTVPVFGGLRDPHRVAAAEARVGEAQARLDDTDQAVRVELFEAYESVRATRDAAAAYAEELQRAVNAATATRASFQAGLLPFVDVARASLAVADAQAKLADARYRYAIARNELARAAGHPLSAP